MTQQPDLTCVPLFSRLSPEQRSALEHACHSRSFPRGALLFQEGEAADGLYVVQSGMVKVFRQNAEGREVILHILRAGQMFAEVPVFQGGTFPASAMAVDDIHVIILPRDALLENLRHDPALAMSLLAAFSLRLKELVDKVEGLAIMEASQRLASYLLYMLEQQQSAAPETGACTVELDISRSLLAGMLGSARETLSRVLARFEESGIIALEGRQVMVNNTEVLRGIAKGADKLQEFNGSTMQKNLMP